MSCKICGPENPNNPRWSVTHACVDALVERVARLEAVPAKVVAQEPVPMRLPCPSCGALHLDVGEFATKPHHTHSCQECGMTWRPAVVHTVGVQFLPGFKNAPTFEQLVAKVGPLPTGLLATAAVPQHPTAEQLLAPLCECQQHGKCFNEASLGTYCARCVSTLNPCTRASHLRRVGSAARSEPTRFGPPDCKARVTHTHELDNGREVFCEGAKDAANAGEATVPTGWKLAPGWRLSKDPVFCQPCPSDETEEPVMGFIRDDDCGCCPEHAEYMRAIVRDEPPAEPVSPALCGDVGPRDVFCSRYEGHELPHRGWKSDKGSEWWPRGVTPPPASWESATESVSAPAEQPTCANCRHSEDDHEMEHLGECIADEGPYGVACGCDKFTFAGQPSRQETPGGETGTIPTQPTRLGPAAPLTTAEQEEAAARITAACRDRAKAKAAELAPRGRTVMEQKVETFFTNGSHYELAKPAEPSGTGQLPSVPAGFRVVRKSGAGVAQSKGLWIRRARDYSGGPPANGEPRQIESPNLGRVWDLGEYDILEPIAEPPAPAVGTLSEAVTCSGCSGLNGQHEVFCTTLAADLLRSLNKPGALAIHRACAPIVRKVAALESRLAQAERERDEARKLLGQAQKSVAYWRAELDKAWKERDERGRQVEKMAEQVATMRVERDEATAKERARCAWWARTISGQAALDLAQAHAPGTPESRAYSHLFADITNAIDGIREGKPAPGTDTP